MARDDEDTKKRAAIRARYPSKPPEGCTIEELLAFKDGQIHLWEAAANQMSDAFVATNHQGRITHANPGAVKLFRQRKEVLEGLQIMDLLQDPVAKEPPAQVVAAIQAGRSIKDVRVAIELPNGDFVFAMMSVVPHVEEGVLIRVFGFFRDLTEIERVVADLQASIRREILNRPYDPDTAFFMRRAFLERLRYQRTVANKIGYPLTLVYVLIGSSDASTQPPPKEAVVGIANALRASKGEADLLCRAAYNGICLLIPGTERSMSELIALISQTATVAWVDAERRAQAPLRVTCHAELCTGEGAAETEEKLLDRLEETTRLLRRDSGTFAVTKPEPS